jgi:MFS superfamily sulfate permease-like transporter
LAEPGTARYTELALLLAFMVSILYLAIGSFRLGAVMSFLLIPRLEVLFRQRSSFAP